MKPRRRPSRRLSDDVFARTLQTIRLNAIAKGEVEPICFREACFQARLRNHMRVRVDDFIIPWRLLQAESIQIGMQRLNEDADDALAPTAGFHANT